jgi:hypothetical protein
LISPQNQVQTTPRSVYGTMDHKDRKKLASDTNVHRKPEPKGRI